MDDLLLKLLDEDKRIKERRAYVENFSNEMLLEISKMLVSSNVDYIKNTAQLIQLIGGLVLSAYLSIMGNLTGQSGIYSLPQFVYFLPIIFLTLSLVIGVVEAFLYQGYEIVWGDLERTIWAYEKVVKTRKRQLIWPSVFAFLGLACFIIIVYYHF